MSFALSASALAGDLDTIGVTLLRQVDPSLTGSGVRVAQPESTSAGTDFEVNPSTVGQSAGLFTWISSAGSASAFPNAVGVESGHADTVAANFYGMAAGAVPQVSHVDNYEALFFFTNYIDSLLRPSIPARVVSQSFAFGSGSESTVEPAYDNYAAQYGTIFVSAVGNGGTVLSPGTCYNSIGVGVYGISSAVGPTMDGRSKPDLVAPDAANSPSGANSYSVPYVAASAAILVQAANRGDGGANTAAAADLRTVKALLLNGAVKPSDWTNSTTRPLDLLYGAGIVNVFNSWQQLKGQKRSFIEATSNPSGNPHPPGANPGNEPVLEGWDLNSITNTFHVPSYYEQVNHYYFQLPTNVNYTMTATLVWDRQQNQTAINNLNLFLYNTANSNLVTWSSNSVDNVKHLFLTSLPPGRYDLQVQKIPTSQITATETYALAFQFFNLKLNIARSNSNVVLSWPIDPAGFHLVSTPSLIPPITWTAVAATTVVSNGQNFVTVPSSPGNQFFRLQRP
jgi:hypothetical protein